MRTLLVLAVLAVGLLYAEQQDGLSDAKAEERLAPEVERLKKEHPLSAPVRVVVIDKRIYGWLSPNGPVTIYIVNRGDEQNKRTLRHEWEHARQFFASEKYDEEKAYTAERDNR